MNLAKAYAEAMMNFFCYAVNAPMGLPKLI